MRFSILLIASCLLMRLHGAENPILVFQKEKEELIKLLENSDLNSGYLVSAAETKSGNLYLFTLGEFQCTGGDVDTINSAKAIAYSKAMRALAQFMKTEVSSEESLKEITTMRQSGNLDKKTSIERVRTSIIKIRSMAIIGQVSVLKSEFKGNESIYRTVLAQRIGDK